MNTHQKSYNRPYGVSVFFPAFNDEDSIARLIHEALEVAPRITNDYEVIVVNDGSSDGTAAVLNDLASREPRLRVIHHPRNRGYGGALRSGFESATKDLIFYTDGDGQYDVREMANLIPLMIQDVDVVTGYKIRRSDSRHRIVLGAIYKFLARRMFGLPIRDVDCDFRLMRREAIQSVTRTGYDFFRLWLKLVIFSTQGRTEEAEKRRHQSERRQIDSVNGLIDQWRAPPDRQHD